MPFLQAGGHRLEYARLNASRPRPGAPALVFLHEGLGSVAMWRDFPRQVADATGCEALVYSRYGYGRSDPLAEPRSVRMMHEEALVVLPELLDAMAIERPVLFGHSDGASIALIHAGVAGPRVAGVVAMAPHVMVEPITIASIEQARRTYETTELRQRLSRYHADVDSAFWGWNRLWLDPAFRDWNIEWYLPRIACPVLAIQGEDDEYGTMEQIDRIARAAPLAQTLKLAECRHSPHRDQPAAVIEATVAFVERLTRKR
jgi:pimeloyl-ACP methyl ester carboxylesterase